MTPITEARLCGDCKIVTAKAECPLCGECTRRHPEWRAKNGFCMHCTDPFPAAELVVITWEHDPYTQMDDGDMAAACRPCFVQEDED